MQEGTLQMLHVHSGAKDSTSRLAEFSVMGGCNCGCSATVQSEVSTFSEQLFHRLRAASVSSLTRCWLLRCTLLFWSANCPGKSRACCVQGPNGFHRRRTYERWRVFKWGRFVQLLSDSGCAVIFCAERSLVVVAFYAKLYAHGESLMWNQSKQAHKERVSQARVLRVKFTCCVFYTNGCYMHLHIYIDINI